MSDSDSDSSSPYHAGMRALQDRFDTRRLADRLDERLGRGAFTEQDKAFIGGPVPASPDQSPAMTRAAAIPQPFFASPTFVHAGIQASRKGRWLNT